MNRPKIPINLEKELEGLLGKCKVGDVLIESGVKSYAQTVRKLSYQYDTLTHDLRVAQLFKMLNVQQHTKIIPIGKHQGKDAYDFSNDIPFYERFQVLGEQNDAHD